MKYDVDHPTAIHCEWCVQSWNITDRHALRCHTRKYVNMKHLTFLSFLFVIITVTLSSCSAIADIFEAGIWTGLIMVVLVVGLIGFLINRMRR